MPTVPNILGLDPNSLPENYPYPKHFSIENIARRNILSLQPYRCARDDYDEGILLELVMNI